MKESAPRTMSRTHIQKAMLGDRGRRMMTKTMMEHQKRFSDIARGQGMKMMMAVNNRR